MTTRRHSGWLGFFAAGVIVLSAGLTAVEWRLAIVVLLGGLPIFAPAALRLVWREPPTAELVDERHVARVVLLSSVAVLIGAVLVLSPSPTDLFLVGAGTFASQVLLTATVCAVRLFARAWRAANHPVVLAALLVVGLPGAIGMALLLRILVLYAPPGDLIAAAVALCGVQVLLTMTLRAVGSSARAWRVLTSWRALAVLVVASLIFGLLAVRISLRPLSGPGFDSYKVEVRPVPGDAFDARITAQQVLNVSNEIDRMRIAASPGPGFLLEQATIPGPQRYVCDLGPCPQVTVVFLDVPTGSIFQLRHGMLGTPQTFGDTETIVGTVTSMTEGGEDIVFSYFPKPASNFRVLLGPMAGVASLPGLAMTLAGTLLLGLWMLMVQKLQTGVLNWLQSHAPWRHRTTPPPSSEDGARRRQTLRRWAIRRGRRRASR